MNFSEEAIYWIVKMRSDSVSDADKQKFSQWLAASAEHRQAFDRQLDQFELLGAMPRPQNSDSVKTKFFSLSWLTQSNLKPWFLSGAVSACLLLLALFILPTKNTQDPVLHYQTARGETKDIRLNDGSKISLNTDSSLSVHFSEQRRALTLHRGEAYFDVAKDRQRPFSVDLGSGKVTAVGTEFNIYRRDTNSQITVTEGRVAIAAQDDADEDKVGIIAGAGQQVLLERSGANLNEADDITSILDWRQRHIRFDNTDLVDVVAAINRYLSEPVAVERHELQQLKVSGGFQLQAPEASMAAIVSSLQLQIVTRGGRRLIIPAD